MSIKVNRTMIKLMKQHVIKTAKAQGHNLRKFEKINGYNMGLCWEAQCYLCGRPFTVYLADEGNVKTHGLDEFIKCGKGEPWMFPS